MIKQKGLTLIEMLISLAIIAIVMTAVAPSIESILIKNKIVSQINELSAVIQFARNNAIDQQVNTKVCPAADYSVCTEDWNDPKIVFIDRDNNNTRSNDEELLASTAAISINNTLTSTSTVLTFKAGGEASVGSTILLCHADKKADYARTLTLTPQGRVKMSSDSDHNGIHEDTDGQSLNCP